MTPVALQEKARERSVYEEEQTKDLLECPWDIVDRENEGLGVLRNSQHHHANKSLSLSSLAM